MKYNRRFHNFICLILVTVVGAAVLTACGNADKLQTDLSGVDYILSQESLDTAAVADAVYEKQEQRIMNHYQEQIESGELDSLAFLSAMDTVILGDSRTLNFAKYFDAAHAMGEGSTNIRNALDNLDQIKATNPRVIVLSYGINDLGQYYFDKTCWPTVDDYIAEMMDIVAQIQEVAPNARIYINSILECTEAGYEYGGYRWRLIPEWNAAIKAYCEEHSDVVGYIDMTEATWANSEYFSEDGIHFWGDFHKIWADEITKQVLLDMSEGKFKGDTE